MNTQTISLKGRRTVLAAASLLAATAFLGTTAFAVTPADIKAKGKLVVGIQAANPPWGFVDATTGQADGIDADMGKAFAKELGVPVEFVGLEVANRIPALTASRVDVLFATMAMLPERAKSVQYSKPYVANSLHVFAPKGTVIKSMADLAKLTVAVPRSTPMDTEITKAAPAGANILRFDNDAATIQALLSGQAQAVGGNVFYTKRLQEAKPGAYEKKFDISAVYNGACVRLGEKDLNAALNTFIDKIKANGELAKIQEKWMGNSNLNFPESIEGVPFVAK